jgi:hypothetical protein
MKPFRSTEEMLAHELMFGSAGRQCAEIVLKWAPLRSSACAEVKSW